MTKTGIEIKVTCYNGHELICEYGQICRKGDGCEGFCFTHPELTCPHLKFEKV